MTDFLASGGLSRRSYAKTEVSVGTKPVEQKRKNKEKVPAMSAIARRATAEGDDRKGWVCRQGLCCPLLGLKY